MKGIVNITIPALTAENPVAKGSAFEIVDAAKAAMATGGVIAEATANKDKHMSCKLAVPEPPKVGR